MKKTKGTTKAKSGSTVSSESGRHNRDWARAQSVKEKLHLTLLQHGREDVSEDHCKSERDGGREREAELHRPRGGRVFQH